MAQGISIGGTYYTDDLLELVGDVVKAAATILAENDSIEDGTTSDAALAATGVKVGVLTKSILAELRKG
jgi:hypothetical protein